MRKILIRFDDLCPTMNHNVWNQIVNICIQEHIHPIVAVIPNNMDKKFGDCYDADFWPKIRALQTAGWTIGLHGLTHVYTAESGGILKFPLSSEFAGLDYITQDALIKKGVDIFMNNGVNPDLWIAPAHSFDKTTIKALLNNGISIISDGFYRQPVKLDKMIWIPCQLWEHEPIPRNGIFTICHHFNSWKDDDISYFKLFVNQYRNEIVTISDILSARIGNIKMRDRMCNALVVNKLYAKKIVKKLLKR